MNVLASLLRTARPFILLHHPFWGVVYDGIEASDYNKLVSYGITTTFVTYIVIV